MVHWRSAGSKPILKTSVLAGTLLRPYRAILTGFFATTLKSVPISTTTECFGATKLSTQRGEGAEVAYFLLRQGSHDSGTRGRLLGPLGL